MINFLEYLLTQNSEICVRFFTYEHVADRFLNKFYSCLYHLFVQHLQLQQDNLPVNFKQAALQVGYDLFLTNFYEDFFFIEFILSFISNTFAIFHITGDSLTLQIQATSTTGNRLFLFQGMLYF